MIRKAVELGRHLYNARLDPESLRSLQGRKLRRLVRHAVREVPYYRDLFREYGVDADDVSTVDDVRRVPITTKRELRRAGLSAVTTLGVDLARCRRWLTSGSTGEPFAVHQQPAEATRRALLEFRALMSLGFRARDRLAVVGPELAMPRGAHERLGLYRTRVICGNLPFEEQARQLRRFDPTVLWVYPTALESLLHHVDGGLRALARPRIVLWSAEVLERGLRDRIVEELSEEVFGLYGCFEIGRLAVECRTHYGFHVVADHVLLEILDDEDRPAAPGTLGCVVVTDLDNLTQPLIRYRLGDVCRRVAGPCQCGSSFPLIAAPDGREHDLLYLPDGRVVAPFVVSFIVRGFLEVRRFRAVQSAPDRVGLELELERPMTDERLNLLRSKLARTVGDDVEVDVRVFPEFPRVVGKTRVVVRTFDRGGGLGGEGAPPD